MDTKYFSEINVGARFAFYGQIFTKTARNTAEDAEHIEHVFLDEIVVETEDDLPRFPTHEVQRASLT